MTDAGKESGTEAGGVKKSAHGDADSDSVTGGEAVVKAEKN